jgi:hypothetical protein
MIVPVQRDCGIAVFRSTEVFIIIIIIIIIIIKKKQWLQKLPRQRPSDTL